MNCPVDIMRKLQLEHKQNFIKNYIQPALKFGLIEMTIPDKPDSRLQKYRLTAKGWEMQKIFRKQTFDSNNNKSE